MLTGRYHPSSVHGPMTEDALGGEQANQPARAHEVAMRPPRRWRLWDIHRGTHGALLALSFNGEELRRLVQRAGIEIPADARYYDIHRHLCETCTSRNRL